MNNGSRLVLGHYGWVVRRRPLPTSDSRVKMWVTLWGK